MSQPTFAERTLYADLTRLLMSSRNTSQAEVEERVEGMLRDFVRKNPELRVGGLQITLSWHLPEGADEWAVYGTEYRTLPAEQPQPLRAVAGGPAEVLAFPHSSVSRRGGATVGSAQIVPFPGMGSAR